MCENFYQKHFCATFYSDSFVIIMNNKLHMQYIINELINGQMSTYTTHFDTL